MTTQAAKDIEQATREILTSRLSQLTEDQQARFRKWFPKQPTEDLKGLIDLCDRTIVKNATNQ